MKIKLILITAMVFVLMAALASASDIIAKAGDLYVAGNVGIGTTSPTQKLYVVGNSATEGAFPMIAVQDGNGGAMAFMRGYYGTQVHIGSYNAVSLLLYVNSTERMRIDTNGNVGIGAINPLYPLYLTKNNPGTWASLIQNTNTGGSSVYLAHADGYGAYIDAGSDASSGTYGLNVNKAGASLLYVAGDGKTFINDLTAPGSDPMCWDGSGYSYIGDCTSLRKYKQNISELNLGLETVLALEPKTFSWKQPDNIDPAAKSKNQINPYQDLGFIAEDVENVNYILTTHRNGTLVGVRYEKLTAVLVNAVKEQQKQIESLKSELCKKDGSYGFC